MSRDFRRTDSRRTLHLAAIAALITVVVAASLAEAQPAVRRLRASRLFNPTVPPGEAARVEEEIEGAVRVAILNLDRSALGALVEAALRDKKMVNWWPRGATNRLLREARMHTAVDLPASSPEVQSEKPPLPDALILVRTRAGGDQQAEVVVCEPGLGLRLGVQRVTLTGESAKDVAALADAATKGLKKLGEKMSALWAVPLFRSGDLVSSEGDLRSSLTRETEQSLLAQKGAFLVELEYAHVIAAARAIAGIEDPVKRPVPRFLLGEYRHQQDGSSLAISWTIQESETPEAPRQLPAAAEAEAAEALRTAVADLVKSPGGLQSAEDSSPEKNLIAGVERAYQKEGNWLAAMALAESRLLLDPNDRKWRSNAIAHAARLVRMQVEALSRRETPGGLTDVPPRPTVSGLSARPLAPEYVQATSDALDIYRRAMHHFQRQLSTAPPLEARGTAAWIPSPGHDFVYVQLAFPPAVSHAPELVAAVSEFRRQRQALILRYNEIAASNGEAGDMIIFSELMPEERLALVARMIVEFRNYPRAEMRNQAYIGGAINYQGGRENAEKFLEQLATLSDPPVKSAVEQHRRALPARGPAPVPTPAVAAAATAPRTEPPPEKPDPDAQVVFTPLSLPWKLAETGPGGNAACELFLPLGKSGDLFCYRGQILLAKKKGEYKLIWEGPPNLMFRHMVSAGYGPSLACFDGKYAWVPVVDPGKPARLLVIDPATEKVNEVTEKDGLPADPAAMTHPQLGATSLAPGKVLLAGSFGRAYLAVATFDPEKGGSVKVIHEARDLPVRGERDQHLSATLAFDPSWLFTLSGKSADGKPVQRVIVGRGATVDGIAPSPLVVDPETGKIEVLAGSELARVERVRLSSSGGELYWLAYWNLGPARGHELWRLALPDLKPQSLGKKQGTGMSNNVNLAFADGKLHVLAEQWQTAASWDDAATTLRGKVPGQPYEGRVPLHSEIHGWLLFNSQQSRLHAVEFREKP